MTERSNMNDISTLDKKSCMYNTETQLKPVHRKHYYNKPTGLLILKKVIWHAIKLFTISHLPLKQIFLCTQETATTGLIRIVGCRSDINGYMFIVYGYKWYVVLNF